MASNKVTEICGPTPQNYKGDISSTEEIIFQNDPNFAAINLYDFWGNGATVNSFQECSHYVSGGWDIAKITIFDIAQWFVIGAVFSFLIYKFFSLKIYKSALRKIKKTINIDTKYLLIPAFILQNYFLFDYIRTKAVRIPRFIDEYISLASNYNFFRNLDFNAGDFIGGSYSIFLTSGPISAIGGVLGWSLTSKLVIARLSNYYWLVLLQIILSFFIARMINKDYKFLLFSSSIFIILVPWWQGSLYMIGEFASVILFTNAIYLLNQYRNTSMFLFSLSIFFGKLLTLVPFSIFYFFWIIKNKNYKNIHKDGIFFSIPLLSWLGLVSVKYSNGNVAKYLKDLYELILGHQSAGVSSSSGFEIFSSIEVQSWNNYDLSRLLIIPLIFIYLLIENRQTINNHFGEIAIALGASTFSIYLWFWLISPTKWMRYSQHFSIILIISLIYFLNFELIKSRFSLLISAFLLIFFVENFKFLIVLFAFALIYIIFIQSKFNKHNLIKILLILVITFDISLPYFEKDTFGNLNNIIESCKENIVSNECLNDYESK